MLTGKLPDECDCGRRWAFTPGRVHRPRETGVTHPPLRISRPGGQRAMARFPTDSECDECCQEQTPTGEPVRAVRW